MELIAQGAEAKVYLEGDVIVKDRFSKKYRHHKLDKQLRLSRTKREAKVLQKLNGLVPVPSLISVDEKNCVIKILNISGSKLSECLRLEDCSEIGKLLGIMHSSNVIHGDLTTSNMIKNDKIYFIDFGLSFFSQKLEDMAVDLHLLNRALVSKHYEIHDKAWRVILHGYKVNHRWKEVVTRYEQVEARGRNKSK